MKRLVLAFGAAVAAGVTFVSPVSAAGPPPLRAFQRPSAGFFSDPDDVHAFYRCVDIGTLTAFRFECGPGLVYEAAGVCVHPVDASRPEARPPYDPEIGEA
ncbi:carbohydrate-binding module family 14 protein [Kitasatospora sp. NPDC059327]|uniref:carbohydrate-binding module family 14 protein n=1 Tax=Kitasatospora sp. NPDC059327 TaxID=3346803 RepID=UPI003691000A